MQAEAVDASDEPRPVAIKALSLRGLRGDWKQLDLFQREAKTLEALQHPGIPRYLDYFEEDTAQDKGFFLVQVWHRITFLSMQHQALIATGLLRGGRSAGLLSGDCGEFNLSSKSKYQLIPPALPGLF